ncbi:uncharacterized protein LOC135135786 [Zophobas morio]|uniref:uncharacterized protein LOC135135786 n=1 Tax=Zophobas morio TaxID=2755281 RepID=UPI0030834339
MDKDINELSKAMIKKAENIIQLGVEKKYITDIPEAEDAKLICVLQVISKFFTESLNLLYAQIPENDDTYGILPKNHNSAPWIAAVGSETQSNMKYHVIVENQKINNGTDTLTHAIQQMFAIYYNFNLAYQSKLNI